MKRPRKMDDNAHHVKKSTTIGSSCVLFCVVIISRHDDPTRRQKIARIELFVEVCATQYAVWYDCNAAHTWSYLFPMGRMCMPWNAIRRHWLNAERTYPRFFGLTLTIPAA